MKYQLLPLMYTPPQLNPKCMQLVCHPSQGAMVQCANIYQYCKYSPQDTLPLLWHVWISCKDSSINAYSPNPEFSLYISHVSTDTTTSVYKSFFSNYETTFQHVNTKFINPLLKHMPLEELLGLWA